MVYDPEVEASAGVDRSIHCDCCGARRMWEEEEAAAAAPEEGGGAEDPAEVLERLARVMGGWGSDTSLRQWQSGRLDPWGQSGSESWFRWVGGS